MARFDELDLVMQSRVSGTPPATFRTLAGTLYRKVKSGSLSYVGTLGKIPSIGTIGLIKHTGTIHRIGTLGKQGYLCRTGTIQNMGTIQRLNLAARVGTIGRLDRVGTCHTGTIPTRLAAQDIMMGADIQARYFTPSMQRGTTPRLGCGSVWTGSWVAVDKYRNKTLMVKMGGTAPGKGSAAIIGAISGTGANGGTFTYYPWDSIGKGSSKTFSFTESLQYARAKVRQHGGAAGSWVPESGGTIQVHWGLQV